MSLPAIRDSRGGIMPANGRTAVVRVAYAGACRCGSSAYQVGGALCHIVWPGSDAGRLIHEPSIANPPRLTG